MRCARNWRASPQRSAPTDRVHARAAARPVARRPRRPTSPCSWPRASAPIRAQMAERVIAALDLVRPPGWRASRSPGPASSTSGWPPTRWSATSQRILSEGQRTTADRTPVPGDGQRRVRLGQPDRPAARRPRPRCRARRRDRGTARVDRARASPASSTSTMPASRSTGWPSRSGPGAAGGRARPAEIPEGGYHGEYLEGRPPRAARRRRAARSPTCRRPKGSRRCRARCARRCSAQEQDETLARLRRAVRRDVVGAGDLRRRRGRRARSRGWRERGLTFEEGGALWLRTSDFGDDGTGCCGSATARYTYLVPDIAYHLDKYERGFDHAIDVWGADHHGYIPRMQAALTALGLPAGLASTWRWCSWCAWCGAAKK